MTKFTDIDQSIEIDGFTLTARTRHDESMGAPWDEHDGHGSVTGWLARAKHPGELMLSQQGAFFRYYDYSEACHIAHRDGWGYAPAPIKVVQNSGGKWHAWFGDGHATGCNVGGFDSASDATAALYASYRATMTPRQYAALAARADFDRLKAWCDDEWCWIGVEVVAEKAGVRLGGASLWGIESDAGDYLVEVTNELISEALDDARAKVAALTA